MDSAEYRRAAAEMVDFIANYHDTIKDRRVLPDVRPGYLRPLLPESAPDHPETFADVMADIERLIMPGMTHWSSPHFHAYFPAASSYPAMLADMLCGALTCIGFTWKASPVCTELEVVMMDWLGELLGLPRTFLSHEGEGGGVIQGTASEATLVAVLSARRRVQREQEAVMEAEAGAALETEAKAAALKGAGTVGTAGGAGAASGPVAGAAAKEGPGTATTEISRMVMYASEEAHCSVERAALLAGVRVRRLTADAVGALRGNVLRAAIMDDLNAGLTPFCVVATLGTTGSCAFDALHEIAEVCRDHPRIWLHVDAAYAGAFFVCPEFRGPLEGVEVARSFNFNPHKAMLVNFDCSAMWVRHKRDLVDAFNVDAVYLRHEYQAISQAPDYRHWQIPLGRRFRSLKLWFVMRLYGKQGLQAHLRGQVELARVMEELVRADMRFEVVAPVKLGLVCFRVKGTGAAANSLNERLVKAINDGGLIHLVPAVRRGIFFLRVAVCSRFTEASDMAYAWKEIQRHATVIIREDKEGGNAGN